MRAIRSVAAQRLRAELGLPGYTMTNILIIMIIIIIIITLIILILYCTVLYYTLSSAVAPRPTTPTSARLRQAARRVRDHIRTILDAPKPRYGGAPNLCEGIY